jgi:hypothetical protein
MAHSEGTEEDHPEYLGRMEDSGKKEQMDKREDPRESILHPQGREVFLRLMPQSMI